MSDFFTQHVAPMLREAEGRILGRVNDLLRNLTARLILRTILTTASEGEGGRNALVDAVEGFLPGDGSQPASDDVERMELAGFLVVPVPKGPAVRLGDNSPVFSFPLAHPSYRPGGGKQGETCQYNLGDKQGTHWIRKDGRIEARSSGGASHVQDAAGGHQIDSNVAQNKDVVVNGGTLEVARKTDPVGWLLLIVADVAGVPVIVFVDWVATDPLQPLPPSPLVAGTYARPIFITDGVPHFLA